MRDFSELELEISFLLLDTESSADSASLYQEDVVAETLTVRRRGPSRGWAAGAQPRRPHLACSPLLRLALAVPTPRVSGPRLSMSPKAAHGSFSVLHWAAFAAPSSSLTCRT